MPPASAPLHYPVADADDTATHAVDLDDPRQTLLERVFAGHCLIDLRFESTAGAYQTTIIELVPEQAYMVLDGLVPLSGNALAADAPKISLTTHIDGMTISFSSAISACGGDIDSPYYKVPYPKKIGSSQRRREFRVKVPINRGINMRFNSSDGIQLAGEVRDLSANGFSSRLDHGELGRLADDALHQGHCEIAFPDGNNISATIEICHVVPGSGRVAPRIGALFVDLDARAERAIQRYVALLDREQARLR
jgi:c-di-GMP-binding flagellar brake protein YcgR